MEPAWCCRTVGSQVVKQTAYNEASLALKECVRTTGGSMLVTGGRDGSINVWSCHRGRHLQAIEKAHPTNTHSSKGDPAQAHA